METTYPNEEDVGPESPSCFNNFWSILGCEDDKIKEMRLERKRDLLQSLRNPESFQEVNESPRNGEAQKKPPIFCCRRKRCTGENAARGALKQPWVWAPKSDENEIDLEWKIVEHELDEESLCRLRNFRKAVADAGLDFHAACERVPHSKRPGTLLRYLRARNWNQEQSLKMLQEAFDWRTEFQLDEKMEVWRAEWNAQETSRVKVWKKYTYIKPIGLDHDGLPIYIHRTSQCDAAGFVREAGMEAFILFHLHIMEECFAAAQERMMKTGKLITNFVEIYDQGDYGLVGKYMRRGYQAWEPYKQMIPILDKVYPERVRVAFVVRCPSVFAIFWRLVEPFVPPATVKKIRIKGYASKTFVAEMKEFMAESTIPPFLRSDDRSLLLAAEPWGGVVPPGAADF